MMKKKILTIGSRGSALAVAQSRLVAKSLAELESAEIDCFPILTFTTSGDKIQDRLLYEAGGKGLFTKELDEALLGGHIDAAVHSMKDLPTLLPPGIVLAAVPAREDPRDAFIGGPAKTLWELPKGATVGTASLRRQAQTLHLRPDLKVEMLRGRVETRLSKIENGIFAATYLGLAGLRRLGLEARATSIMDPHMMPPAPGQGALAITARADDRDSLARLGALHWPEYGLAAVAERAFLAGLDGSCRTPIAALARVEANTLDLLGEVLTPDGVYCWRRQARVPLGEAAENSARALGARLASEIRSEAGPLYNPHLGDKGW